MCEKLDWMSAHLSIFHVGIGLLNFIFINYCPPIFEPRMPSIDCFTIGSWLNLRVKQKRLISQLRKNIVVCVSIVPKTWLNLRVKRKRLISQFAKNHVLLPFYCTSHIWCSKFLWDNILWVLWIFILPRWNLLTNEITT